MSMLTRSHIPSIYAGVRVHMRAYLNTYAERHAHPYKYCANGRVHECRNCSACMRFVLIPTHLCVCVYICMCIHTYCRTLLQVFSLKTNGRAALRLASNFSVGKSQHGYPLASTCPLQRRCVDPGIRHVCFLSCLRQNSSSSSLFQLPQDF